MALSILYVHDCSKRFNVYFPKAVMFGEIRGDNSEDWKAIDRQEEEAGEIELARRASSKISGASFVDIRETQLTLCDCGEWLDFKQIIKSDLDKAAKKKKGDNQP